MAILKLSQAYTINVTIETDKDTPGIENIIEATRALKNFIQTKSEANVKVSLEADTDVKVESIYLNNGVQYSWCQLTGHIEPYDTGHGDDPTEW